MRTDQQSLPMPARLHRPTSRKAFLSWILRQCVLSGMVILSFAVSSPAATAGVGPLAPEQLNAAIEDAQLATAVYDLSKRDIVGGWHQIASKSDADGFQAAVYERQLSDGRRDIRVVFAGTNEPVDWVTNVAQGISRGAGVYDAIAAQQYARAQAFAAGYAHLSKTDASIASVRLVGHSLGGALAQYASAVLDLEAIAFNSAALLKMRAGLTPQQAQTANEKVVHFYSSADPVFAGTRQMPGATHLGATYRVSAAPEVEARLAKVNAIQRGITGHTMELMTESLSFARLRTASPGDLRATAALREEMISRRVEVSMEAASLWAANVKVVADGLSEMKHLYDRTGNKIVSEQFRSVFGSSRPQLERFFGHATKFLGLASAIEKDRMQFTGKSIVLMDSHTVNALADLAADKMFRHIYEHLDAKGFLGYQARVSLSRQTIELGAPSAGILDFGRGAAQRLRRGHWDVDSITSMLDGAVGLTWAALGLTVSGGNLRVAEFYQDAGVTAAQTLRFAVAQAGWDKAILHTYDALFSAGDFSKRPQQLLSMYEMTQQSRAYRGQSVQTLSQYLEGDFEGSRQVRRGEANEIKKALDFGSQHERAADAIYEQQKAVSIRHANAIDAGPRNTSHSTPVNLAVSRQADIPATAALAARGQRAIVVGTGEIAERASAELTRRLGANNVKVVSDAEGRNRHQLGRIARDFNADTVVRVRSERYNERFVPGVGLQREPLPPIAPSSQCGPQRPCPPPTNQMPPLPGPPAGPLPSLPGDPPSKRQPAFAAAGAGSRGVGGVLLANSATVSLNGAPVPTDFALMFTGDDGEIDVRSLRMFVTALWAIYFTPQAPGISIDPIGRKINKHAVRYIGNVLNSDLGRVMREADYLMKQWAVGSARPALSDFQNPEDIANKRGLMHIGAPSRFWFIPENFRFQRSSRALLFDGGQITLKTEFLLKQLKAQQNPENEAFAKYVSENYWRLAALHPVLSELFEYAKHVSLAAYLKSAGVPLLSFLLANRELVLTETSPGTVEALLKQADQFPGIQISGGVDMAPGVASAQYVMDESLARALTLAPMAHANSTFGDALTVADTRESSAATPSVVLTLGGASNGQSRFAADLVVRVDGQPGIELSRQRVSSSSRSAEFGAEWQLAVPYRIEPAGPERIAFRGARIPQRMKILNLLSGTEQVFDFNDSRYSIVGYLPADPKETVDLGLFPMSDGAFRLVDKIGNEFHFDATGQLTEMKLLRTHRIAYRRELRTAAIPPQTPACRLVPQGKHKQVVANVRLPQVLRLECPAETIAGSLFELEERGDRVTYVSADGKATNVKLSFWTDGSFVLHRPDQTRLRFDAAGRLRKVESRLISAVETDQARISLRYEPIGTYWRVAQVEATSTAGRQTRSLKYEYDRSGSLTNVRAAPTLATAERIQIDAR